MARLLSCRYTVCAVIGDPCGDPSCPLDHRAMSKTVTRRIGWLSAAPGDRLCLVRQSRGRRVGDPLDRLAIVELVGVDRVPLVAVDDDELRLEGFDPGRITPTDFVRRYFVDAQRVAWDAPITRLEWRYLAVYRDRPRLMAGLGPNGPAEGWGQTGPVEL